METRTVVYLFVNLTIFGASANKYSASKGPTSPTQKIKSHRRHSGPARVVQSSFVDSPAIIRTPQAMKQYHDLDYAMQRHLDSEGAGPSKPSGFQLPSQRAQTHLLSNNAIGSSGPGYLSISVGGGTGTLAELQSQLENVVQGSEISHTSLSRTYRDYLTTGIGRESKRSDSYATLHRFSIIDILRLCIVGLLNWIMKPSPTLHASAQEHRSPPSRRRFGRI